MKRNKTTESGHGIGNLQGPGPNTEMPRDILQKQEDLIVLGAGRGPINIIRSTQCTHDHLFFFGERAVG